MFPGPFPAPLLPVNVRGQQHQFGPVPGQIFRTMISIQSVLYDLAEWVAACHGIQLTNGRPVYDPSESRNYRPCIFLFFSARGIHVLPTATFNGSDPKGWNLFLQEIVVPLGDKISPVFRDRRAFQTTPDWTQRRNLPSYIIPHVVILPHNSQLDHYPVTMPRAVTEDLFGYCHKITTTLRMGSNGHIRRLLKSYEEQPTGTYRTRSGISEEAPEGDPPVAAITPATSRAPLLWPHGPGGQASVYEHAHSQYSGQARSIGSSSVVYSPPSSVRGYPQTPVMRLPPRFR